MVKWLCDEWMGVHLVLFPLTYTLCFALFYFYFVVLDITPLVFVCFVSFLRQGVTKLPSLA